MGTPTWNWTEWNRGERLVIAASILAVVSLFMPWADAGIITETGWEQLGFIFLAAYAYPLYKVLNTRPTNRWLAVASALLALVLGVAYFAGNIQTIEAGELFNTEEETLNLNGFGIVVYLLSTLLLLAGTILNRRAPVSEEAPTSSEGVQN